MSNRKMWTTRNGEKIRIKDMSTSHIKNVLAMLERIHKKDIYVLYFMAGWIQGEQASDDLDRAIDMAEEENSDHPLYDDLLEELEKRQELSHDR